MNNAKNYSEVVTRFLRYIKVDTQSDEASDNFPSTEKQKNLAIRLAQELKDIGLTDVDMAMYMLLFLLTVMLTIKIYVTDRIVRWLVLLHIWIHHQR